jgi:prepilin-type N-terminal cleavage/methylation domain-containing protein
MFKLHKIILKSGFKSCSRAFTLVEMIFVISISAIIVTTTVATFSSFGDMQSIDKDVEVVQSYLNRAKNQTLNSKNGSKHGVYFASSSVTLFEGSSFVQGSSTNIIYNLSNKTEIHSINLFGQGGVQSFALVFDKVTGKPSATGTVSFRLKSKPAQTKSIVIYGTGLVETN